MISRELKLKLTKTQEATLNQWLWRLTDVYNWAIRKIELNAENKIYFSKLSFQNSLSGVSTKIDIPSHVIQGVLVQAYISWQRCLNKISNKPKLKSSRNKLRSIPFPDPIKLPVGNKINLPLLKGLKFHKQELPQGKIKCGRIIKNASGWYLSLTIDTNHTFIVENTESKVGIDTGFKDLAILSNGTKYSNRRNFVKAQTRIGQAQRGGNKKLVARLHERVANRRKDYNHKISTTIVKQNKEIYITNDNLRGQAKIFGKSVTDAGIAQLRSFIQYKSVNHERKCELVNSVNTTKSCSSCGSLTGPCGLKELNVRNWECSACGAHHDRDINSAINILNSGLGCSLVNLKSGSNS